MESLPISKYETCLLHPFLLSISQILCKAFPLRLLFVAGIFRPFRENSRQHGGNKSKLCIIRDEGLLFAETVYNLHTFQHDTFLLLAEDINIMFSDWQTRLECVHLATNITLFLLELLIFLTRKLSKVFFFRDKSQSEYPLYGLTATK